MNSLKQLPISHIKFTTNCNRPITQFHFVNGSFAVVVSIVRLHTRIILEQDFVETLRYRIYHVPTTFHASFGVINPHEGRVVFEIVDNGPSIAVFNLELWKHPPPMLTPILIGWFRSFHQWDV